MSTVVFFLQNKAILDEIGITFSMPIIIVYWLKFYKIKKLTIFLPNDSCAIKCREWSAASLKVNATITFDLKTWTCIESRCNLYLSRNIMHMLGSTTTVLCTPLFSWWVCIYLRTHSNNNTSSLYYMFYMPQGMCVSVLYCFGKRF